MRWIDAPPISAPTLAPDLPPLLNQALARRGLTTPDAARAFLDPRHYRPTPADAFPAMEQACRRIREAIRREERICVWGDFDVDGQTATALLVAALERAGAQVVYHIPQREREGRSMKRTVLDTLLERGVRLIITCDTGMNAHEAIAHGRTRGADFIITDHHELPAELPAAVAILNPRFFPDDHPLAGLAGVGVAYKLAEALLGNEAEDFLDFVALGCVADLAPLRAETRYLTRRGLERLRADPRLGLRMVMELAGLQAAQANEEHLAYVLAPRFNAMGRLGDATPAVELLLTREPGRARLLATQLENYNIQRQWLTAQVTRAAEGQLRAEPSLLTAPVILVARPAWPSGVLGIVAARLVERYRKPAIVLTIGEDGIAHGSARSVAGFDITAAIAAQRDLLLAFGGHPMAAGLSLPAEALPEFRRRLYKSAEQSLAEALNTEPTLEVEAWLELEEANLTLAETLERLAPYGVGNEKIVLASRQLTVRSMTTLGRHQEHMKLTVCNKNGYTQEVLWWDVSGEEVNLEADIQIDLAYTLRASDWRGVRQVQLELIDFRLVDSPAAATIRPVLEVVDYRHVDDPFQQLEICRQMEANAIVLAEGEAKAQVQGRDRNELERAETLLLWSIPPSLQDFRQALAVVQPQKVYLFAISQSDSAEEFAGRLAGLVKYAIQQYGGRTSYAALAAATGHCVQTVRRGIAWLAAQGSLNIQRESEEELILTLGTSLKDPVETTRLWYEIQRLVEETRAYRAYFRQADKEALIG